MHSAKDLHVAPISPADANACVRRHHYSGQVVQNSQLHLGVFLEGRLEGAMQFGPSLVKRNLQHLVADTPWNGFIELNRLAFSERLPRNSESRALGYAFRLMRREYPHLQWVISFADGAQCGDGAIYRASGFVLTAIKANTSIWEAPTGEKFNDYAMRHVSGAGKKFARAREIVVRATVTKGAHAAAAGGNTTMKAYAEAGWKPLVGYQLRYIYFLDSGARARLTVPIVPFSKIAEMGAGMYRGQPAAVPAAAPEAAAQ